MILYFHYFVLWCDRIWFAQFCRCIFRFMFDISFCRLLKITHVFHLCCLWKEIFYRFYRLHYVCTLLQHSTKSFTKTLSQFSLLIKLWSQLNHFFLICHSFNVISLSPLLIVVVITALKQAYEDILRFKSDLEINNRSINTFRDGKLIKLNWKNIVVSIFLFFTFHNS